LKGWLWVWLRDWKWRLCKQAVAEALAAEGGQLSADTSHQQGDSPPGNNGGGGGGGDRVQMEHAYNISDRASRNMAKKREVQPSNLRERLEPEQLLAYDAILAEKRKKLAVRDLIGGRVVEAPDVGSMLSNGDHRLLAAQLTSAWGSSKSPHTASTLIRCSACARESTIQ
jgi:hypothetical protein